MRAGLEALRGSLLENQRVWDALAVITVLLLYGRTVGYGWVYDDQMEIVLNPFVRSLENLPLIFSTTVWAGSGMETYLYRPLALVSYALNHMVSGLAPWSYHLVNVLLFAGITLMVLRLARRWGLSVAAAGLAGLIFALHPVHVEVVAPAFGRKDLLATFFVLVMVLLHLRALEGSGWRMALPVLAFAGAVLSKEVGVVGLALVAVQDWILAPDVKTLLKDVRRSRLYVGYVAVLLGYILVRNQVTGGVGVPDTFYMDNPLVQAPLAVRWATALVVVGKGMVLQLLPLTQSPDYSFNAIPLVRSPMDPRFLGTLGLLALLAWGFLRSGRWRPLLALVALWYGVALLPTANLLVLVGTIFGERLLFLPSVAFSVVAGAAGVWLARKTPWGLVPLVLWAGVLTVQTVRYTGAWRNDIALFQAAVAAVPGSTKAQHKLGEELLRAGEVGASLPHLREALRIAPDNEFAAITLSQARDRVARRYLPVGPEASRAADLPEDPEILYTLGDLSRQRGDMAGAHGFWTRALELDPNHSPTLADRGLLALTRGDTARALQDLQGAVREDPGLARAWYNLGRIHLARGDMTAARRALARFIQEARGRFPQQVSWAQQLLSRLPDS